MNSTFKSSANKRILTDNGGGDMFAFLKLLKDFEYFAAKYKAETGLPAVLVLDNVNVLVDKDPEILDMLQDCAKEAVDNELTTWSLCALMERHQPGWKGSSDCQLVNANADTPGERSS